MIRPSRWTRVALGGVAAVVAASLASPVVAVRPTSAHRPALAPALDPAITAQIARDPAGRMRVFVHADTVADALAAAKRHEVRVVDRFTAVDVAVVEGPAEALPALLRGKGVRRLEADAPIRFMTDTSHLATRSREARETFKTVPVPKKNGNVPNNPKHQDFAFADTIDGTGVSIAIVDSGIDGTHPMLTRPDGTSKVARNLKLACHGLAADDEGVCGPDRDTLWVDMTATGNDTDTPSLGGHGTHVASTAAGVDYRISDTRLLSGAAPDALLIGLSVGQVINVYGGATGLLWVLDHHADPCGEADCPPIKVVNNSWGPVIVGQTYDPTSVVSKIQDKLVDAGITVVWSNGNGDAAGDGGDGTDVRSSIYGQSPTPGIISVANYSDGDTGTREGTLDSSSSRGKQGSVATYPDISAPGTAITAACRVYLAVCNSGELDYGTIGGTSMAAPHVAGIAAQLLEVDPSLTPAEIENVLEDTAYKFRFGGAYEPDLADRNDGTTSFDKGHGLVDATAAIAAVLGVAAPAPRVEDDPFAHCVAEGPVVTDPTGDATKFALVEDAPNEPGLDFTELRVGADGTTLGFIFTLDDLTDQPASLGLGNSIEADFGYGTSGLNLTVSWANGAGPSASLSEGNTLDGYTQIATLTPVLDYDADTITVPVTYDSLDPVVQRGSVLTGFVVRTRYDESPTPLGPVADDSVGNKTCPYTVGYGAVPPPPGSEPPVVPPTEPTPDATLGAGQSYAWAGEPTTASDTLIGPMITATGKVHDTRLIRLTAGGTLTVTVQNPATSYLLLTVFDKEGNQVAYTEGLPTEEVTLTVTATAGDYVVDVGYFVSAEAEYAARATLT